ncbi:MAG: methyltransferase domain-containing protein [Bacillota bacterium]
MRDLSTMVTARYTRETGSCLSCGNNLQYLGLKPGEVLLDLGSGNGHEALEAALAVEPGGKVYGIDLTPAMVEQANLRREQMGIKNAEFVVGTMDSIPFADGTVDAIISNCAINHVPDKGKVFQEMFRVLKPNGRFVVSDVVTLKPLPREIVEDLSEWADCFGGAITREEYDQVVRQCGFEFRLEAYREYFKKEHPMASITIMGTKHFSSG